MSRIRRPALDWYNLFVSLLVAVGVLLGAYYPLRYAGSSTEPDASRQSVAGEAILVTGYLENNASYTNGYGYAVHLAFTSLLTGLRVPIIQTASALWLFLAVLAAFICYRELLGSPAAGILATVLLLIQPDFLFYVVRGSHEKFTWPFAFLLLYLLARSYRKEVTLTQLAVHIVTFYLIYWSMAALNVYFAATFLNAITLSMLGGWLLHAFLNRKERSTGWRPAILRRYLIITMAGLIIVFVAINYAYRPTLLSYSLYSTLVDQVSLMVLGAQEPIVPSSYTRFQAAWRSPGIYLALTGLQWIIAIGSIAAWADNLRNLKKLDRGRWLLWLMHSSFGFLLVFGIVADYAGFLNKNLQLRMFTPFTMFSCAMVADYLIRLLRRSGLRLRRLAVLASTVLCMAGFATVALKITNDPSLGNQWLFYTKPESRVGSWMQVHLDNAVVWTDSWDHLPEIFLFDQGYPSADRNNYFWGFVDYRFDYIVKTKPNLYRANRVGAPLPSTAGYDRIYDNGIAELFKFPAKTPYQR